MSKIDAFTEPVDFTHLEAVDALIDSFDGLKPGMPDGAKVYTSCKLIRLLIQAVRELRAENERLKQAHV